MLRNPLTLLPVVLLVAALAAGPAYSEGQDRGSPDNPAVVVWPDLPPWCLWNGGQAIGRDRLLLDELAKRANLSLRYQACDIPDCLDMLRDGRADLASSLLQDPERDLFLAYLKPPVRLVRAMVFFSRAGQAPVDQWRDLYGKRIAIRKGTVLNRVLEVSPKLTLIPVRSARDAIKLLLAHKVDLAGLNQDEARWWQKQLGLEEALEEQPLVLEHPYPAFVAVSRASPLLKRKKELERALADMAASGFLERYRQGDF